MARRTAEQAQQTRAALLQAALDEFLEHGGAAPGLDQIAKRAQVTRGAVYFHFKNKRQLISEVCSLVSLDPINLPGGVAGRIGPLLELRELVKRWMRCIEDDKLKQQVLDLLLHKLEKTVENEPLRQGWTRACNECIRNFERIFSQVEQDRQVAKRASMSARTVSVALQAALLGLVSRYVLEPSSIKLEAAADWLLDSLLQQFDREARCI